MNGWRPGRQGGGVQPVAGHARVAAAAWPADPGACAVSRRVSGEHRVHWSSVFHTDPDCRIFLSTDAGGVGLKPAARRALVVNMTCRGNLRCWEQRIGRVHRMGQSRGVQVVNLIARAASKRACWPFSPSRRACSPACSTRRQRGLPAGHAVGQLHEERGAGGRGDGGRRGRRRWVGGASGQEGRRRPSRRAARYLPRSQRGHRADADPWADLLQPVLRCCKARCAAPPGAAPSIRIERDPQTGQPSCGCRCTDPSLLPAAGEGVGAVVKEVTQRVLRPSSRATASPSSITCQRVVARPVVARDRVEVARAAT